MAFKITIIGAGSVGFTKKLCQDILKVPEFEDVEIALTDINAMIDRINLLMLNNTMTTAQRAALVAAVTPITNADAALQARRRAPVPEPASSARASRSRP